MDNFLLLLSRRSSCSSVQLFSFCGRRSPLVFARSVRRWHGNHRQFGSSSTSPFVGVTTTTSFTRRLWRYDHNHGQGASGCFYCSSKAGTESKVKVKEEEEGGDGATSKDENLSSSEGQVVNSSIVSDESRLPSHQKRRKERDRGGKDLVIAALGEEEAEKERKRYERDLPPVELERHRYWKSRPERSVNKVLIRTDLFERIEDKNKETFSTALELFVERDIHLRGHVEFIYAALSQMQKFGVHRDLEVYKKIIDIFPKGKMIATNMFQVEFMHYPKQQQCGIDILEQMENYGVIPDSEVQSMFTNIFGSQSFPMRKAMRMLYWMPKFAHISPWRLPDPLPDDSLELAKLAIQRITSIDLSTVVSIYNTEDLEDAYDLTWVVSGQSLEQQRLIESHPPNQPIYVEGAFRVWLSRTCMNYFILRAEPRVRPKRVVDADDVEKLNTIFDENWKEKMVDTIPSVHEQEDGVILGVCATGTSSKDSIVSWIQFLEKSNPRLGKDIPILFTLKSPIGPTDDIEIPSFEDAEKVKLLQQGEAVVVQGEQDSGEGEASGFSGGSGGNMGIDPRIPSVKQVGVWTDSESQFPNWPHYHHPEDSLSMKNLKENLRLVDELEKEVKERKRVSRSKEKAEEPKQIQ